MLSVLFFTGRLCGGGSERVTSILANYFVSIGVTVTVVTIQSVTEADYPLDSRVVRICLSGMQGHGVTSRLKQVLKIHRPDIMVSMAVPISLYAIPAALATRTKIIVSERTDPSHSAAKKTTLLYSRFLLNFADGYVFQSTGAKAFYGNRIQKKSVIIGNPLRADLPEPFQGIRKKEIVTAGRLIPLKNHRMLINAFAEVHRIHPDYRLVIYGEGPCHEELRKQSESLGVSDSVSLPGFATDVNDKIRLSSVFAFTSDYEGLPNSVLEAMGMGIPVVATDCPCGGVASLITNDQDGILIGVGEEKALATSLLRIIEDENFARQLGEQAEKVRIKYAERAICSQWYDYITKVVG